MQSQISTLDHAVKMFVAVATTLDEERTRFTGMFIKHQKQGFNALIESLNSFKGTIKANMQEDNIKECERIQDYIHDLVYDLIKKEGELEIYVFAALLRMLKIIYLKYIHGSFKHNDKMKFVSLYLIANGFSNLIENSNRINNDIENFCITLIEGREFKRNII